MNVLQKQIIQTLRYFSFFQYAPTFGEIHMFLSTRVTRDIVRKELAIMMKKKAIQTVVTESQADTRYTLGEYVFPQKKLAKKIGNSSEKIRKSQRIIHFFSYIPSVLLIGLSGSVAMMNAEHNDDIDLFIITAHNRIWTTRFFCLLLAHIMGVRRKRTAIEVQDKVCMNLFFSEKSLTLPNHKQSYYGAHEVLQMKPRMVKDDLYRKFLTANQWVFDIFPNARNYVEQPPVRRQKNFNSPFLRVAGNILENILKKIQLHSINTHKTTELISDEQLWFFPKDFERKIIKVIRK